MLRTAFRLTVLAAAAVTMVSTAHANNGFDPEGRYNGGAPMGGMFGMYGSSPVARATVSYPSNERPGTIIVNARVSVGYTWSREMARLSATGSASAAMVSPGAV